MIFFFVSPLYTTLNPNFCISFLIFGPIFGIQGKVIVYILLMLLLLLSVPRVFFLKLLIVFCNVFYHAHFRKIYQSDVLFPPSNIFHNRFFVA